MGIDYHGYVGTYIEYKARVVTKNNKCPECPDRSVPFCPKCGKSVESRESTWKGEEEYFYPEEEFNDRMCAVNDHPKPLNGFKTKKVIPNVRFSGFHEHFDPQYQEVDINLLNVDPALTFLAFQREFENEIKTISEKFGDDNVSIKYGILIWAS